MTCVPIHQFLSFRDTRITTAYLTLFHSVSEFAYEHPYHSAINGKLFKMIPKKQILLQILKQSKKPSLSTFLSLTSRDAGKELHHQACIRYAIPPMKIAMTISIAHIAGAFFQPNSDERTRITAIQGNGQQRYKCQHNEPDRCEDCSEINRPEDTGDFDQLRKNHVGGVKFVSVPEGEYHRYFPEVFWKNY